MQVLINGKPELKFDAKKERKLSVVGEREFAEGKVMSEEDMVGSLRKRTKIIYTVLGVISAIAFIGLPFADLNEASFIVPVDVVIAVALFSFMRFMYRRNIAKETAAAGPRLKRMALLPGTTIRADATGLTIGGRVTPWSDLTIDTLEIIEVGGGEGENVSYVGALLMTAGGKAVVLDNAAITDGRLVLDYVWRRLRGH